MVVYCNSALHRKDFVIPVVDDKDEADIEVYVLESTMTPLDLMKAFRACRVNPMKAWYYIPPEPKEFHDYAYDAIHRGTLNIYHDWEVLTSALSNNVLATTEKEIQKCVTMSFDNFGYDVDEDMCRFIADAVLNATDRYGAYPACKALLQMLESGKTPNVPLYNNIMKSTLTLYAAVENAVNEFRQNGSHILGVLASERIYKIALPKQEEFDRVTVHVMFQPLTPEMHDLKGRCQQIVRVAKENVKG
ncbi:MAG: hypothetical protein NC131_20425 [Roseburia sp.]|nr:hypothetical protein [Roseburia sp.]